MIVARDQAATMAALPPPWPQDVLPRIRDALAAEPRKVWILDDDPTGTQTICNLPVLTEWSVETLRAEFEDSAPACFVLTNSRALPAARSEALHREFARNLRDANDDRPFSIISRGDSTLRGHFPLETDTLATCLGGVDLTLLAPFFAAGGRYTIGDVHYVADAGRLVPAAETAFARDPVFGYRESHLARWIEEKSAGRISADRVVSLSLELIRREGPAGVGRVLRDAPSGSVVIANAIDVADIEVVAYAVLAAEAAGRRILARTAAGFVAARVGQRPPPLLAAAELANPGCTAGGLIVAGSHVPQTTLQLERLRAGCKVVALELPVDDLLKAAQYDAAIAACSCAMNEALAHGRDTLVFTSRELRRGAGPDADLAIGRRISEALVAVVHNLTCRPRYLIAKGGITSSDVATVALGVRRGLVRGQLLPGVPVWMLGQETRFHGLSYVIFPGNVGGPDALLEAVRKLSP